MSIFPCVSWVRALWGHVCALFVQNTTVDLPDLPYEIIADIFSRLPAELVFLCGHACKPLCALTTSPSFVGAYQSRATPVIAFQYFRLPRSYGNKGRSGVEVVGIFFTDEVTKKIAQKSIKIDVGLASPKKTCAAYLYGSYNGLLLFRNFGCESVLVVWNPISEEQVSVIAPDTRYGVRGLFFHPTAKEYRVIFLCFKDGCYQYVILSLATKSSRRIKSYSHPPSNVSNPVFLHDVLHWIICEASYNKAYGFYPPCSESIILFDVQSEEFSTISHPEGQCLESNYSELKHIWMQLMENEGLLCLCDASSYKRIVVWILEDYERKVWVKRHVIMEPLKMFSGVQCSGFSASYLKALHIYKDEVLLSVNCEDIFLYDMRLRTLRRVGKKWKDAGLLMSAVHHVNTPASLQSEWHNISI